MSIQAIRDKVVVERIVVKETITGIILPDAVRTDTCEMATVISVGSGKVADNGTIILPAVNVGDVVYFNKFAGLPVKENGKEYQIIAESDILALSR